MCCCPGAVVAPMRVNRTQLTFAAVRARGILREANLAGAGFLKRYDVLSCQDTSSTTMMGSVLDDRSTLFLTPTIT